MRIQITDKKKKDIFVSVFQVLKNCSSLICVMFETELVHIQGMDKSHVCLFDAKINSTWFNTFEIKKDVLHKEESKITDRDLVIFGYDVPLLQRQLVIAREAS